MSKLHAFSAYDSTSAFIRNETITVPCVCEHVREMTVDVPESSRTELEKCMVNHRPHMLTNYARQKFQCKVGPTHSNYGGINYVSTMLIITEVAHSEDQLPN